MKKIVLIAAMVLGFALAASAQNFRVGARIGSGFQAQGEYVYSDAKYFEGRFGIGWYNSLPAETAVLLGKTGPMLSADFTVLHNWNVCTMDWTPSAGLWFFDAGAGLTVGGGAKLATFGVVGCAKLGFEFNNVPCRVAIDYTPSFGPMIYDSKAYFNMCGFVILGASAVFSF